VGYPNSIDELLVSGGSAAALPLLPHCQQSAATLVRGVQYKVCTYVTLVSATAGDTSKGYWLTVITDLVQRCHARQDHHRQHAQPGVLPGGLPQYTRPGLLRTVARPSTTGTAAASRLGSASAGPWRAPARFRTTPCSAGRSTCRR
jgi:hypothetical protein